MSNDALGRRVRLPVDRWGTVIKVHPPQKGSPPVYDIKTDEGEIIRMVEIAEGSLISQEDYGRLVSLARGVKDGTTKTIDVTDWTDEQFREHFSAKVDK